MRTLRSLPAASATLALGLALAAFSPAAAQSTAPPGTVLHLSPYAGYMVFGNYLNGPLGTSVSNAPGVLYGTQVGLSLSNNLSLIGNIGYSNADIQVGVPIFGDRSLGQSSILMYDAGLEYSLGGSKAGGLPFSPFIQAGAGAMRYNINASILTTQATNFAGNVGVGADFSLGRGVALRLLAKDYIGKFNFQDATGFGINGSTANNIALTAGLRLDF
ncbi:MAG: outer membrane beta-barrel protein [Gemmatimonadales bacterium]